MVLVSAALGVGLAIGLAAVVYWDADRIDMRRPTLWAGVTFATIAAAVAISIGLGVPPAGSAVVGFVGPAIYLFEREDAVIDPEPDERTIPEDGIDPIEDSEE